MEREIHEVGVYEYVGLKRTRVRLLKSFLNNPFEAGFFLQSLSPYQLSSEGQFIGWNSTYYKADGTFERSIFNKYIYDYQDGCWQQIYDEE